MLKAVRIGNVAVARIGDTAKTVDSVIQADNKILICGQTLDRTEYKLFITRFNTDGSLDTTFGTAGTVTTFIGDGCGVQTIGLQSDEKIVVAGYVYDNGTAKLLVARYTTSGALDTGFGSSGYTITQVGDYTYGHQLTILGDDSIVVVCESSDSFILHGAIAKFDASGALDTGFGSGGSVFTADATNLYTVTIQTISSVDYIVAAGYIWQGFYYEIYVTRYDTTGAIDTSFASSGNLYQTIDQIDDRALSIAIDGSNNILVGGYNATVPATNSFVIRYDSTGALDTSFNGTGIKINILGTNDVINDIRVQGSGKIVVVGKKSVSGFDIGIVLRYNTNGTVDTTFNGNLGIINIILGTGTIINNFQIQNDNKLVFVGTGGYLGLEVALSTRYSTDGILDTSYGFQSFLVPPTGYGNVLQVDKFYGDDSAGNRNSRYFLTITAAAAKATAGDLIYVYPGTYNETPTIPTGVHLKGSDRGAVTISKTATTNTDLITLNPGSSISDLSLSLGTTGGFNLKGINFGGLSAQTATVSNVNLNLVHQGVTGTAYGIYSGGTGASDIYNLENVNVTLVSTSADPNLGIYLNAVSILNAKNSKIKTSGYGIQTNDNGAVFNGDFLVIEGNTGDISQELGQINLYNSRLVNQTSDDKNFTAPAKNLIFSNVGTIGSSLTRYYLVGSGISAVSNPISLNEKTIVRNLRVKALTGPGTSNVDTWTVYKNGVATSLDVQLADSDLEVINDTDAVTFQEGDEISVRVDTDTGSTTADTIILLDY